MNIKRIIPALFLLAVVAYACKKTEAPELVKLVVSRVNAATPYADSVFTMRVEAKDQDNGNQVLDENTTITLTQLTGTGHLTGTLSKVMKAPENLVDFTDLKYDSVENEVIILVSASNSSLAKTLCTLNVTGHMLIFKFKFDSTQIRLNNLGNPNPNLPAGHAAQSPRFNKMSAHYIELSPDDLTPFGGGQVIYRAPEIPDTSVGAQWPTAIDFNQSIKAGQGEVFYRYPLKKIAAGSYKWLRVSLSYQNYDINYRVTSPMYYGTGTIASFIGFNTYIGTYTIKTRPVTEDDYKLQGYWGFETYINPNYLTLTGQAPQGSTTVVNPLTGVSDIPPNSCVVTGQFTNSLLNPTLINITGLEHSDITVTVSVSTNQSFEWVDSSPNGFYEPWIPENELVVDMGVRGIIPIIQY
jgi:hypothetical protein